MKKRYFSEECVFAFIWTNADPDGLWNGDACTIADHFRVPEDEAHLTLINLCERGFLQQLESAKFIIVQWPERDKRVGEEPN